MLGFRGGLPLLFFLLVALSSFPSHISSSSSDCQRTCGSTTVPYPFGFSDGCNIALNCSTNHTKIRLGDFQVRNITSDSLLVDVPPACNRHVNAIKSLFGTNYALTRRNGLFLRNCTSDNPSCLVPTHLLSQKDLDSCGDNTTCFSDDGKPDDFLAAKKITAYGCSYLVTSMGIERDANDSLHLPVVLQTAVVEWWLEGQCRCSPLANFTNLTSPVTGKPSFRCKCLEGFHGDGFNDSLGCQKGQSALSLSFALPGETKPPRKKNPLAPIKVQPLSVEKNSVLRRSLLEPPRRRGWGRWRRPILSGLTRAPTLRGTLVNFPLVSNQWPLSSNLPAVILAQLLTREKYGRPKWKPSRYKKKGGAHGLVGMRPEQGKGGRGWSMNSMGWMLPEFATMTASCSLICCSFRTCLTLYR